MLALFDRAVEDRFLRLEHRNLVMADIDVDMLLARLASYRPVTADKLIDRAAR